KITQRIWYFFIVEKRGVCKHSKRELVYPPLSVAWRDAGVENISQKLSHVNQRLMPRLTFPNSKLGIRTPPRDHAAHEHSRDAVRTIVHKAGKFFAVEIDVNV